MLDLAFGLPTHILVIHSVVVGVPLMALVTAAVALGPAPWRRAAPAVAVLDALLLGLAWVASESGARLQARLAAQGNALPEIQAHADLGATVPWFVLGLLVAAVLVAVLHHRGRRSRRDGLVLLAAGLVVVTAAASVVQVVRVGHSGSSAVWGYVDDSSTG